MNFTQIKELDQRYVLQTYSRNPVAIDHGRGATLWDTEGKEYIDFTSGIGVCSLGYGNADWARAIYDQAMKLGHISNLFYTEPYARLASKLVPAAGMAAVFFGNSGAEANEGMIKTARKYSFDKYGPGRSTIITLNNSFHGRTITTLKATGQDHFHEFFFPSPRASATPPPTTGEPPGRRRDDVCAVMMELIQGEGGVNPLTRTTSRRWRSSARTRTGSSSSTRSRPAWAAPAPSSPISSSASSPTWCPSPRASPGGCPSAAF